MRNWFEPVGQCVAPCQHRKHAWHGARRLNIDGADQRVRVWRTQDSGIRLVREVDIVAIAPATDEKTRVLLAVYRVSDPYLHCGFG
jgi:hypothetical protein